MTKPLTSHPAPLDKLHKHLPPNSPYISYQTFISLSLKMISILFHDTTSGLLSINDSFTSTRSDSFKVISVSFTQGVTNTLSTINDIDLNTITST